MKRTIKDFYQNAFSPSSTLRTILLFGRNVSTYKFALVDALLQSDPQSYLSYADIRDGFLKSLYQHYLKNPNQYQTGPNSLTRAFDQYSNDQDWENLIKVAMQNIYNNVFDAFHNVGGSSIKLEYALFEHDKKSKQLVLSENIHRILDNKSLTAQLLKENQSRWAIVEEAWKNKLSPNLLVFDADKNIYSISPGHERVNLRSAVDVLLPYQHSRCFYCNKVMDPQANHSDYDFPDVEHTIPHSAFNRIEVFDEINPGGIWNLVVACHECNRGKYGKFNSPPHTRFFDKLISRNMLFTQEHRHSMKNTILLSMGARDYKEVKRKMAMFRPYIDLTVGWEPKTTHYE